MKFLLPFFAFFIPFFSSSQVFDGLSLADNPLNKSQVKSNLKILDDGSFEKLSIKGALYDPANNNLPYFRETKISDISNSFNPRLIINSVFIHDNSTSGYIKKLFGNQLVNEFNIRASNNLSGNQRINYFDITPLRINQNGLVEELIDFEVQWGDAIKTSQTERMSSSSSFTNNSILATGKWYKLAIVDNGIYKIDRNFLIESGIDISSLNPKNIRVYGNGGIMLPEKNGDPRYDDLQENAIQVVGESDNSFDGSDYVLFYGQGITKWKYYPNSDSLLFEHQKNLYTDTAYYYLNFDIGPGKRVTSQSSSAVAANVSTSSFDYYNYHELDQINFVKSGRNLYGEYFDVTTSYNFLYTDNNFVVGDTIRIKASFAGRGNVDNSYNFNANGTGTNVTCAALDLTNYLSDYASLGNKFSKGLNSVSNSINVTLTKLTPSAVGWLDKFSLNARRQLVYNGLSFNYRDTRITGTGNLCAYTISNGNSGLQIWDITDYINPYQQNYILNGSTITYTASSDSLNEYIIFNPAANTKAPVYYGEVANQNLHSVAQADYIIVVPKQFLSYANRLAQLHQQNEGLTYIVATTEQVYNEFGSGKNEPSAIRDFARMLYWRGISLNQPLKYMALFGRGSYYNRNGRPGNTNLIPTYETENSVSYIYSVSSDDFYALMDDSEGYLAESYGAMDIGVGRLIATTPSDAESIVSKIENYYKKGLYPQDVTNNCNISLSNQLFGDWRNNLLFCADDGDNALHMTQADNMANKVKLKEPKYNITKVYIDAYKGLSTPGGKRYPDMQEAFNSRINKGCLIMNYTGHGGEVGLSAERVVDIPTINSWHNLNGLPLFITATCEFSRYDDPDRVSAGEYCLLNPNGGALALMTTCRLAFSNFNETLNNKLFDFMFKKQANNKMPALGDVVHWTKQTLGQNFFYANFHLLGDPAVTLAYPQQKIYTTFINGNPIGATATDTIKGLSKVTVKGFVGDTTGAKLTGFNGIIYPSIFDKSELIICQLNDPSSSTSPGTLTPFQFYSQQNIIYKGKAQVTNGDFSFSFVVPKDVSFNYGNAKFSYYATDGTVDASGNFDSVKVGGLSIGSTLDDIGPNVKLYLNSKSYVNGGITNENPIIMADITDSSGVNTVGTGFGHDIVATLDDNTDKPYVLNDSYEANLNSYQSGTVRYQLNGLSDGDHNLALKVWDVQNNSSTVYTNFIVAKSAELALDMVLNYPNPFTTNTKFFFEHNRNCEDLKVVIQIFTISGKVAKTITTSVNCEGFRTNGISWDGRDDFGDKLGRGVYLYKLSIIDKDNKKAEKLEKLVILN